MTNFEFAIVQLDSLIGSMEMGSEIPVQLSELKMLRRLLTPIGPEEGEVLLSIGLSALQTLAKNVMTEDLPGLDDGYLTGYAHGIVSVHAAILKNAARQEVPPHG